MTSTSTEPAVSALRSFALIVGGALLLVAVLQWRRAAAPWVWTTLAALAALLVVLSLLAPLALRPVYRGWMRIGEVLGWVNTRIILTLVFFLVVTPIGLLMRLFGQSPIARKREQSYWTDVEVHSYRDRHVEKQF